MCGALYQVKLFLQLYFLEPFFNGNFQKRKRKLKGKKKTVMITQVILAFRKGTKSFENIKHQKNRTSFNNDSILNPIAMNLCFYKSENPISTNSIIEEMRHIGILEFVEVIYGVREERNKGKCQGALISSQQEKGWDGIHMVLSPIP